MSPPFATIFVAGLFSLTLATGPSAAQPGAADAALLDEINVARTHPEEYAQRLEREPVSRWERALAEPTDPAAVAEAIAFLRHQAPLPPLGADQRLAEAAREHVSAQGPAGAVGHEGPGGESFDMRLLRHGVASAAAGENIAYGPGQVADVVRELIIDSGVASRGHRNNIFQPAFEVAGVTCGPHRDYRTMCVIDFAGGLRAGPASGLTRVATAPAPLPPNAGGVAD